MFTQCPKCETVFRLSAEALRAAGGQVRCGRCGDVFNALTRLAEDSTGFDSRDESPLALETRADAILRSTLPVEPADTSPPLRPEIEPPPGVEIAELRILDPLEEDPAENSLEFTLPPGELDRIFVETTPNPLQQLVRDGHVAPPSSYEPAEAVPIPAPERSGKVERPIERGARPLTRIAGLEISEDVRQAMMSSYRHAELPEINPPLRRLPFAAWLTVAIVLAALLIFQIIRDNGGWLSAHAHLLGGSAPAASLSAYQLRQWGVTGDPGAKGTLRVRASIMNTAGQLQPYPLLRVTLANRFGTRVGAREFEPAEYAGKPTARMLAPGERVDATLDILDPGKDAEGFEIDVCVRSIDQKVICADDAATRTK